MRILIVDDNKEFAVHLQTDLFKHFCEMSDQTQYDVYFKDFSNIKFQNHYDLAFLDIDLPNNNGIEIAKSLRKDGVCNTIIFVSSHQHLVYNSLVARPFFFMRKNEYKEDLRILYDLLYESIAENEFVSFKWQGKKYMIKMNSIKFIESENQILNIHTTEKTYLASMNLKDMLEMLDSKYFVQVHKSYIINLNFLVTYNSVEIELIGKNTITIGRSYKNDFIKKYKEFLIR